MYGRHLPELRDKAEEVLRSVLEEDTQLVWINGGRQEGVEVRVEELEGQHRRIDSRVDGGAAGATRRSGLYLGTMAKVADAEEAGVTLASGYCDTVALGSQGVIRRIQALMHLPPRSRIEEKLVAQMVERPRRLMWAHGHQGEEGNEERPKGKADSENGGANAQCCHCHTGWYSTSISSAPEGANPQERGAPTAVFMDRRWVGEVTVAGGR